jgi:hypothetical protein
MQVEGQADAAGGGAPSAAALDAALDAAFAAVEGGDPTAVPEEDASTVAELLVRGLASTEAGVACRAAAAIARFARAGPAAAHAIAEASGGAAMPALARLATTGDDAAAGAAISAVASVISAHKEEELCALVRAYAATDGAVEAVIKAVMQQAAPVTALRFLAELIYYGEPQLSAQVAAADGLCARLAWFVAAICDRPWQPETFGGLCCLALNCLGALMVRQPQTAAPAFMAAEGFWPALEAVVARAGSCTGEVPGCVVEVVLGVLMRMAQHSTAAVRRAAGRDGLLAALAAALTRPECRASAEFILEAVAMRGDGKAAVAVAVARVLAAATDEATRE